jgi:hypothetical protein
VCSYSHHPHTEIGALLTVCGLVFTLFGMLLLFDRVLMALGNVSRVDERQALPRRECASFLSVWSWGEFVSVLCVYDCVCVCVYVCVCVCVCVCVDVYGCLYVCPVCCVCLCVCI